MCFEIEEEKVIDTLQRLMEACQKEQYFLGVSIIFQSPRHSRKTTWVFEVKTRRRCKSKLKGCVVCLLSSTAKIKDGNIRDCSVAGLTLDD